MQLSVQHCLVCAICANVGCRRHFVVLTLLFAVYATVHGGSVRHDYSSQNLVPDCVFVKSDKRIQSLERWHCLVACAKITSIITSSMIASSVNCQPWIIGCPFNFMNDGNLGATVCRKWKPWWTKCKWPDVSTKALSKTKDAVPRSQSKSQQLVIAPPPVWTYHAPYCLWCN